MSFSALLSNITSIPETGLEILELKEVVLETLGALEEDEPLVEPFVSKVGFIFAAIVLLS